MTEKKLLLDRFAEEMSEQTAAKGPPEELLNDAEVAAEWRLSKQTLQAWRMRGKGPDFIRISSHCVRYKRSDLIKFLQERAAKSTSD